MPAESPSSNPYAEDDLLVRADATAARSCAEQDNPYAAPDVHLSNVDEHSLLARTAKASGFIDAWRDGEWLVVKGPGRLPKCCLKCGRMSQEMEMLRLVSIKPQQTAGGWVTGNLCPGCAVLHRCGEFGFFVGICGLIAAPLFMACLHILFPFSSGTAPALVSAGPIALMISSLMIWLAAQRIATLSEISVSGDNRWLLGASRPFLDRLPLFPRS